MLCTNNNYAKLLFLLHLRLFSLIQTDNIILCRLIMACFNLRQGEGSYCIIQLFEPIIFGISVSNDYDCPLLSLLLFSLFAHCVLQSVSIIHECTSNCMVKTSLLHVSLNTFLCHHSLQKQLFVHKYTNNIFML